MLVPIPYLPSKVDPQHTAPWDLRSSVKLQQLVRRDLCLQVTTKYIGCGTAETLLAVNVNFDSSFFMKKSVMYMIF